MGNASNGLAGISSALADAGSNAVADLAGNPGRLPPRMVIGSIFTDEFLRAASRGETMDVPLATIIPLLAMENLLLRTRLRNLEETLKQERVLQTWRDTVYEDE